VISGLIPPSRTRLGSTVAALRALAFWTDRPATLASTAWLSPVSSLTPPFLMSVLVLRLDEEGRRGRGDISRTLLISAYTLHTLLRIRLSLKLYPARHLHSSTHQHTSCGLRRTVVDSRGRDCLGGPLPHSCVFPTTLQTSHCGTYLLLPCAHICPPFLFIHFGQDDRRTEPPPTCGCAYRQAGRHFLCRFDCIRCGDIARGAAPPPPSRIGGGARGSITERLMSSIPSAYGALLAAPTSPSHLPSDEQGYCLSRWTGSRARASPHASEPRTSMQDARKASYATPLACWTTSFSTNIIFILFIPSPFCCYFCLYI